MVGELRQGKPGGPGGVLAGALTGHPLWLVPFHHGREFFALYWQIVNKALKGGAPQPGLRDDETTWGDGAKRSRIRNTIPRPQSRVREATRKPRIYRPKLAARGSVAWITSSVAPW